MKAIVRYACEKCGCLYDDVKGAESCENRPYQNDRFNVGDTVEIQQTTYDGSGYSDTDCGLGLIVRKNYVKHMAYYNFILMNDSDLQIRGDENIHDLDTYYVIGKKYDLPNL